MYLQALDPEIYRVQISDADLDLNLVHEYDIGFEIDLDIEVYLDLFVDEPYSEL